MVRRKFLKIGMSSLGATVLWSIGLPALAGAARSPRPMPVRTSIKLASALRSIGNEQCMAAAARLEARVMNRVAADRPASQTGGRACDTHPRGMLRGERRRRLPRSRFLPTRTSPPTTTTQHPFLSNTFPCQRISPQRKTVLQPTLPQIRVRHP